MGLQQCNLGIRAAHNKDGVLSQMQLTPEGLQNGTDYRPRRLQRGQNRWVQTVKAAQCLRPIPLADVVKLAFTCLRILHGSPTREDPPYPLAQA